MRTSVAACAIAAILCLPAHTADSPAQQLFNRVRDNVRSALERVPRYTCVQTITRKQYRPQYGSHPNSCPGLLAAHAQLTSPGLIVWHDRLRLDVAVGEKAEMFSYAGAKRFETGSLSDLALSGSTGSGSFSSFLASVFGPDAQDFRYIGEKEIAAGRFAAFTYSVPLSKTHYSYSTHNGKSQLVPFTGAFYAVPVSAELKRLIVEATQFPSGDVCRVVDTMDYHKVTIGSGDFILPEVSTMEVLYRDGQEDLNETRYSGCHEFTGESTIRFDDPDEPGSAASTAKAELKALPPKTRIRVKIDPPLNSDTAAAGDAITGVVEHEVKSKGQLLVRTTDRLHGRVLRLEQHMLPQPRWILAIRFDSIERDGVEQEVAFKPLDDGDRSSQTVTGRSFGRGGSRAAPAMALPERPTGAGIFIWNETGRLVLDQKFHSEWETK